MKPGYPKIITAELVLLDKGINPAAAQLDIIMICALAATERTEWQWQAVMDAVGLVIEKIWTKLQEVESIIVLVPKMVDH